MKPGGKNKTRAITEYLMVKDFTRCPPPGYEIVRGAGNAIIAHESGSVTPGCLLASQTLMFSVFFFAGAIAMMYFLGTSGPMLGITSGCVLIGLLLGVVSAKAARLVTARVGFDTLSVRVTTRYALLPCGCLNSVKEYPFSDLLPDASVRGADGVKVRRCLEITYPSVRLVFAGRIAGEDEEVSMTSFVKNEDADTLPPVKTVAFWRGYTNFLRGLGGLPALVLHGDSDEETAVTLPVGLDPAVALRLRPALEAAFGIVSSNGGGVDGETSKRLANVDEGRLVLSGARGVAQDSDDQSVVCVESITQLTFAGSRVRFVYLMIVGYCVELVFALDVFAFMFFPLLEAVAVVISITSIYTLICLFGFCRYRTVFGLVSDHVPSSSVGDVTAYAYSLLTMMCLRSVPDTTTHIDWSHVVVERSDIAEFNGCFDVGAAELSDAGPAADAVVPFDSDPTPGVQRVLPEPSPPATSIVVMSEHRSQVPEIGQNRQVPATQELDCIATPGDVVAAADWETHLVAPLADAPTRCGAAGQRGGDGEEEEVRLLQEPGTRFRMVIAETVKMSQSVVVGVQVRTLVQDADVTRKTSCAPVIIPVAWDVSPEDAAPIARRFERMFVGLSLLLKSS